jgi:hypothetical protein
MGDWVGPRIDLGALAKRKRKYLYINEAVLYYVTLLTAYWNLEII